MSDKWPRGRRPKNNSDNFGCTSEKKILRLLPGAVGDHIPEPVESTNTGEGVAKKEGRCLRHSREDRQQRRYAKNHICL